MGLGGGWEKRGGGGGWGRGWGYGWEGVRDSKGGGSEGVGGQKGGATSFVGDALTRGLTHCSTNLYAQIQHLLGHT